MHLPNKERNSATQIPSEIIFSGSGLDENMQKSDEQILETYRQAILQEARENEVLRKSVVHLVIEGHENNAFQHN